MVLLVHALDPEDDSTAEILGEISRYSFPSLLSVMLIIIIVSFNKNTCSFALWNMITFVQFVRLIPLIDVDTPRFYDTYFEGVSYSMNQIRLFSKGEDLSDDYPRFPTFGIKSYNFLDNADESFFLWAGCVLFTLFNLCFKWDRVRPLVLYNLIIRATLVFYLDLIFFAMLNVKSLSFSSGFEVTSSFISIILIFSGVLFMFVVPISTKIAYDRHQVSGEFKSLEEIDTLSLEFTPKFPEIHHYYTLFTIIRFTTSGILILLSSSPIVQIVLIIVMQSMMILYLIFKVPFKHSFDNLFVTISETCCFVLALLTGILHSDDIKDDGRAVICYICVFLVWFGEIVCISRFLSVFLYKEKANQNVSVMNMNVEIKTCEKSVDTAIDQTRGRIHSIEIQDVEEHKKNKEKPYPFLRSETVVLDRDSDKYSVIKNLTHRASFNKLDHKNPLKDKFKNFKANEIAEETLHDIPEEYNPKASNIKLHKTPLDKLKKAAKEREMKIAAMQENLNEMNKKEDLKKKGLKNSSVPKINQKQEGTNNYSKKLTDTQTEEEKDLVKERNTAKRVSFKDTFTDTDKGYEQSKQSTSAKNFNQSSKEKPPIKNNIKTDSEIKSKHDSLDKTDEKNHMGTSEHKPKTAVNKPTPAQRSMDDSYEHTFHRDNMPAERSIDNEQIPTEGQHSDKTGQEKIKDYNYVASTGQIQSPDKDSPNIASRSEIDHSEMSNKRENSSFSYISEEIESERDNAPENKGQLVSVDLAEEEKEQTDPSRKDQSEFVRRPERSNYTTKQEFRALDLPSREDISQFAYDQPISSQARESVVSKKRNLSSNPTESKKKGDIFSKLAGLKNFNN